MDYFDKWGNFPSEGQQSLFEQILQSEDMQIMDIALQEMIDNGDDAVLAVLQAGGKSAASKTIGRLTIYMVAQEVAKSTIPATVSATGRRGAVVAIETTAKLGAMRGAQVGFSAISSMGISIAAAAGE